MGSYERFLRACRQPALLLILLFNYLHKQLLPLHLRRVPVYRLLELSRSPHLVQALLKETGTLMHIKALASGEAPGSACGLR